MVKRIGIFSDLHGDRRNLDLIVKSLQKLGVSSTLFLGDALYETLSTVSQSEKNRADFLRINLRGGLRSRDGLVKEIEDGLFSDEQFEYIVDDDTVPPHTSLSLSELYAVIE